MVGVMTYRGRKVFRDLQEISKKTFRQTKVLKNCLFINGFYYF